MMTIIEIKLKFRNDFVNTYEIIWNIGNKEYMSEARLFEGNLSVSSIHSKKVNDMYMSHNVRLGKTQNDIRNIEKELKNKVIEFIDNNKT